MTTTDQDLRTWTVILEDGRRHSVRAVYFQIEDALTVFKEGKGKAVFAAATSRVVSIVREETAEVTVQGKVLTETDLLAAVQKTTYKPYDR